MRAADSSTLFDATSGGSAVAADGGVARFEDKSGNGRHYTQSTSGDRPLRKTGIQNGRDILRFDGTSDRMSVASSTAMFNFLHFSQGAIFFAGRVGNSSNPNALLPIMGNGGGFSANRIGTSVLLDDRASVPANDRFGLSAYNNNVTAASIGTDNTLTPNTFQQFSTIHDIANGTTSAKLTLYVNGINTSSTVTSSTAGTSSNASNDWFVGDYATGSFFLAGDVGEIIILNSLPSTDTRQKIEGYLAHQWGTTSLLDASHPYKNAAPTAPSYKYPSLRTTLPVAGYYARLDAGAAASDQFPASQSDGVITGATRTDNNGLAYTFSGAGQFIAGLTQSEFITTSGRLWTISAWVYPRSLTGTHSFINRGINGAGNSRRDYLLYADSTGGTNLKFSLQNSNGTFFPTLVTSEIYPINQWYHLCGTCNSAGAAVLYVNGVSLATGTLTTCTDIANMTAIIGASYNGGAGRLYDANALIDDVLFYGTNLSATDVGYLASQRGAIYQLLAGSSPINGQSLIRPADSKPYQQLIGA